MSHGGEQVRFALTGEGREVAYLVLSEIDGPVIVHMHGGTAPIDILDEDPLYGRFLHTLGGYGTLVLLERPGIGASDMFDPDRDLLDQTAEAVVAVLDELRAEEAWLALDGAFGPYLLARFIERFPARLAGASILNPWAPIGDIRRTSSDEFADSIVRRSTGGADLAEHPVPSRADDPTFKAWQERAGRLGASASVARSHWTALFESAAGYLATATPFEAAPPVQLIHRRDAIEPEHVEWWCQIFPEATTVVLEGIDRGIPGPDAGVVADTTGAFMTGRPAIASTERPLVAILFTDLVASTTALTASGDAVWHGTLTSFEHQIDTVTARHDGRLVKLTGDGAVVTFPSGTRAIRAARELRSATRDLGQELRSGVHVGEIELRGEEIGGLAVHLAARVMAEAGPGEIMVTSAVAQTTAGSGLDLVARGAADLKGIDVPWQLFALDE